MYFTEIGQRIQLVDIKSLANFANIDILFLLHKSPNIQLSVWNFAWLCHATYHDNLSNESPLLGDN